MNILTVKDGITTMAILSEIMEAVRTDSEVLIQPIGTAVISQTLSAIDTAKAHFKKDGVSLSVKAILFETDEQNHALKTALKFQVKVEPFIVEIAYVREEYKVSYLN